MQLQAVVDDGLGDAPLDLVGQAPYPGVEGQAGLVGLAETLQLQVAVPLLDSLTCLVQAGLSAARLGAIKPRAGSFASPTRTGSVGLSPHLATCL